MEPGQEKPTQPQEKKGWPGRRASKWWVRKQAALAALGAKKEKVEREQAMALAPEIQASQESVHSSMSATTLPWLPSQEAN